MLSPHPVSIASSRRRAIDLWDRSIALETLFQNRGLERIGLRPACRETADPISRCIRSAKRKGLAREITSHCRFPVFGALSLATRQGCSTSYSPVIYERALTWILWRH